MTLLTTQNDMLKTEKKKIINTNDKAILTQEVNVYISLFVMKSPDS
jgi:hypothetical protein